MRVPGALPLFSQEVQRAAANSGWLLADRLVRGGGSLVLMVLIGRWLGPRSFGLYSYALAMTALFAPIASLGLEGIVVRNLVLNPEKSGKTLTEALFLRILGGLTALAPSRSEGGYPPENHGLQPLMGRAQARPRSGWV